jgi:hypothetical protein
MLKDAGNATIAVNTRVAGRVFSLNYVDEFTSRPNSTLWQYSWNGTVREGNQVVGQFTRNLVSGSTYSLDMSLGPTTHSTRRVESAP